MFGLVESAVAIAIARLLAKAKNKGITATEIADSLEVKPYTLTNWKTGRTKPNIEQIDKLKEWANQNGFEQQVEDLSTPQILNSIQNLQNSESKKEETSDGDLNMLINIFKNLKNPKNKQELINMAFKLWQTESQINE
jgi:transcriptional regulator with XRE-family HTH domain